MLFLGFIFSFKCYGQQSCVIVDYEPVVCNNEPVNFELKTKGTCTINEIEWVFSNTQNDVETLVGAGPHSVTFVNTELTDFSISYYDDELDEHIDTVLSFKVIEPVRDVSIEPLNPCIGETIKLRAEGTDEGFFAWKGGQLDNSFKDQNLVEISDSIVFEQQNYNLKWYLGNTGDACSIRNFDYTVNAKKTTPLLVNPSNEINICEGDQVKLEINGFNEENTYVWQNEDSFIVGSTFVIKPENLTNVVVSTFEDGCFRSENVIINVQKIPTFSIEPANAMMCKGSSLKLNVVASDLYNEEISYSWTGGGNIRPLNTFGNVVEITPESNTTIYTASWEFGDCKTTAKSTVTISENATDIIGDKTINICNGEAVDLTVNTPSNGVIKWYESSFPDSVEAQLLTVSPEKTTTYEVHWTDGNCTDSGKVTVVVNPKPVLEISSSVGYKVCEGEPIDLQVLFTNGSFSKGFIWSIEGLDSLEYDNQLKFVASQSDYVTATWIDSLNHCKEVVSENIYFDVLSKPQEIFLSASKKVVCEGETVTLNVDGASLDNFVLLRDADAETTLDDKFDNGSIEILPDKTTNYIALWVNEECVISSDTFQIIVNAMPDITINNNKKVCPGTEFEINIQPSDYSVYLWSGGDIPPTDLVTGSKLSRGVKESTLSYSLRINNNNCILDTAVTIHLVDLNINAVSDKPENEVCEGESAYLSVNGADSYLWEDNEILSGDLSNNPVASPTKKFTQLKVQAYKEGCLVEDSLKLSLKENPVAEAEASEHTTICYGDIVQLSGYGGQNYLWKPDLFLDNNEIQNPVSKPEESTIYTLTVIAENGCTDTDSVSVNVNYEDCEIDLNKIFVPNTITPNGDNINDTWEIPAIADLQDYSVTIFTEFGTTIYNKTGYQNEFDGVNNGYLPEGTYYYIIRHLNSDNKKTGTLTIIR